MLSLSKNSETLLLRHVALGDEKAFRQLFDHYWRSVYGVALAFTKSRALSEELVQDIFLRIWLKREKLSVVERFNDYLFIVARNHIFNKLQKKLLEEPFTSQMQENYSETAPSPEQQLELRQTEQLVNQAVEQLPPQQHLIYYLSRKQGLSHEEIARQLAISTHTVKSHMNKALHFIRNYLRMHAEI